MDESLENAIHHSPLDELRKLIDLGADPNYESDEGYPSLHSALVAERPDKYQVLETLLDAGADRRLRDASGGGGVTKVVGLGRADPSETSATLNPAY